MSKLRGAIVGAISLAAVNTAAIYAAGGTEESRKEAELYMTSLGYNPEQVEQNFEPVRKVKAGMAGVFGLMAGGAMGAGIGGMMGRRKKAASVERAENNNDFTPPAQG